MKNEQVNVLYIGGETRSGSTILSNALGSVDGYFNTGEIIEFWDLGQKWPCSCGLPSNACNVWKPVFEHMRSTSDSRLIEKFVSIKDERVKSKNLIKNYLSLKRDNFSGNPLNRAYIKNVKDLYFTIKEQTKCDTIIDASKNIYYGYLLSQIPGINLFFIHLIRDPRAIVFSWSKKKKGLWKKDKTAISLRWIARNIAGEILAKQLQKRYLRLFYEDFCRHPQTTINIITALIAKREISGPFLSQNEIDLKESHGLCGNPDRFNHGVTKIREDRKWMKDLTFKDKFVVSIITSPLVFKYRYPLFP